MGIAPLSVMQPLLSLFFLPQALTCSPHPPEPGEPAVLRATDRAGAPIPGLTVEVEQREVGVRTTLPATDAQGNTSWTPAATGLHVASARYASAPDRPPCLLLLAIQVPPPGYGTPARVVMVVAGILIIALNVRAFRRMRREQ